ncbi:MAG: hypothetical protein M3P85_02880 [Actinomycetota bacterium]|nr:hypothetical protein [Actinomycetota bacterium]
MVSAAGLAVLAVGGAAWACAPGPSYIEDVRPTSGPVGTQLIVSGRNFSSEPVELRWGSASGQQLAVANGPDFDASVHVPDSPPGTYDIVGHRQDRR